MSFVNDLSEVAKEYGLELTSDQISVFNRYYELLVVHRPARSFWLCARSCPV